MPQREWCISFERLNGDATADVAHDWQVQELADEELLIRFHIRHNDF